MEQARQQKFHCLEQVIPGPGHNLHIVVILVHIHTHTPMFFLTFLNLKMLQI